MELNVLERILEGSMEPTDLPIEILREITDDFSIHRIIGEGGFGTVYKGVVRNGNVAVKRIRSIMTIDQKLFRHEVESLMEVNHLNVVQFLGLCSHTVETPIKDPESQGFIYAEIRERILCFEYISNGSLDKIITDEFRGLEWDKRYNIIKGICAGLHYLHTEKRILHLDLKPANILVDNQMVPKITDFGLSRSTDQSQTMSGVIFSSPGYGAPENLLGLGSTSFKSDMYSLGVIIIELVTGHKGTPDSNSVLRRWRHRWNKSGKETPLEYQEQVTKCIKIGSLCQEIDPHARPSISEIMCKLSETESMDNHNRNVNQPTVGQRHPLHWEDDMLGVQPLELQFLHDKKQSLSCSVELSNDMNDFIAFQIQTMSMLPYSIEPNMDIVKPQSKCSVDITLPAANAQDHQAAIQRHASSRQHAEEFIVRSIKVNEGITKKDINKDMFDKHTTGHHVDEINLAVVSEEHCNTEVMDSPSKQDTKQYASSGTRLPPIAPGSVQMVIRSNKKSALLECNSKVMLELTGGDHTGDRPGLDLVMTVDVSDTMQGEKMGHLKTALRFVVQKLSPIDRLSIYAYNSDRCVRLFFLLQMTEDGQRYCQDLINGIDAVRMEYFVQQNYLHAGLEELTCRKVRDGRVAGIMYMSDGNEEDRYCKHPVESVNVPVYTFGLGGHNNHWLCEMSDNSMGGTFSDVQDIGGGGLAIAVSQCLAGMLTVSVRDLELTVAAVGDESMVLKVTTGTYRQERNDGSVTVHFGDLYSREVRNIIVDLRLPAVDSEYIAEILKVTYSYSSSTSALRQQFVVPPEMLMVRRTGMEFLEEEKPAELLAEESRLYTVEIIKRARDDNHKKLQVYRKKLEDYEFELTMLSLDEQDPTPQDETKLQVLKKIVRSLERFNNPGLGYTYSSLSLHGRQRFAVRGCDMQTMRLFATPYMDKYLEQATKFHGDPTMQLPSADDDIKEEAPYLTNNVARREEEIQRLRLNIRPSSVSSGLKGIERRTT